MSLKDELAKAMAEPPINHALAQVNDWLAAAADKFAANIPKFIRSVARREADWKLLEDSLAIPLGRVGMEEYAAALPRIETLPGFVKLRQFCAAPERDVGFVFDLSRGRLPNGEPQASFFVTLQPSCTFADSRVRFWDNPDNSVERPLASPPPARVFDLGPIL